MAMPTSTTADFHQCSWPSSPVTSGEESQLPSTVPTATAMTVVRPRRPLAAEMLLARSISGMLPSLAGPNSAACEPISATTRNIK